MSAAATPTDETLRTLFETIPQGIAIYSSTDGTLFIIDSINSAGERMAGVKIGDIIGKSVCEVFPGVMATGLYDALKRVWETGTAETLPPVLYNDSHITRYFENQVFKLSDTKIAAVYNDVTEKILSDKKLRESERRFRNLFNTMHEGFASHEVICNDAGEATDYRYLDINPAFEKLTGLKWETTIGRTVREVLPGIEEEWIQCFGRVALTGIPDERESHVRELDRYYRARAYSPEKGQFAVVFAETTEQKRAEAALRESHDLFALFMKYSPIYTFIKEIDGDRSRVIELSDNFINMVGIPASEMRGRTMEEIFPAEFARKITEDDLATISRGDVLTLEESFNGLEYITIKFPILREGKNNLLAGFTIDITDRKLADKNLRNSEERFRALSQAVFGGIVIHEQGIILECNQGLSDLTGYSYDELIGMQGFGLIAPESMDTVLTNVRNQYEQAYDVTGLRKDGSRYPLSIRGKQMAYQGRNVRVIEFLDITERKRLEEEHLLLEKQLLYAQKLESLGVLAGGIAHDFNNLLMAIMGNADLALMRISKESPAVDNLRRIEQAAARAADLAKQMLAYSGKGRFVIESIDLNKLIEEMFHMLEVSISKKAVLRLNPYHPLPSVEVDTTQMRQVIMNLVINASEAIGDKSGIIAVTTGVMDCDRNYLNGVWLDENLRKGSMCILR